MAAPADVVLSFSVHFWRHGAKLAVIVETWDRDECTRSVIDLADAPTAAGEVVAREILDELAARRGVA
jgi:hypothetical protein